MELIRYETGKILLSKNYYNYMLNILMFVRDSRTVFSHESINITAYVILSGEFFTNVH